MLACFQRSIFWHLLCPSKRLGSLAKVVVGLQNSKSSLYFALLGELRIHHFFLDLHFIICESWRVLVNKFCSFLWLPRWLKWRSWQLFEDCIRFRLFETLILCTLLVTTLRPCLWSLFGRLQSRLLQRLLATQLHSFLYVQRWLLTNIFADIRLNMNNLAIMVLHEIVAHQVGHLVVAKRLVVHFVK